ncbi:conjugal transfer protein TraD [Actimicrobium sp. GrIS 1.19]|uniref:conjugal transfer protein TraD n=1 Tax=Actimicrobium sp. GrIS 1.19 TaxID=3071708 RepID=UPI002E14225A
MQEAATPTPVKAKKDAEWMAAKLAYIRGLKSPSAQQKLFDALAQIKNRNALQVRQFAALVKAEKLEDRAADIRRKGEQLLTEKEDAERARKARTRQLVALGGLIAKAGIDAWPTDRLLGLFMAAARGTDEQKARWSTEGAQALASLAKK